MIGGLFLRINRLGRIYSGDVVADTNISYRRLQLRLYRGGDMRGWIAVVLAVVGLSGCSSAFWSAMGNGMKGAAEARREQTSEARRTPDRTPEKDVVVCRQSSSTTICY